MSIKLQCVLCVQVELQLFWALRCKIFTQTCVDFNNPQLMMESTYICLGHHDVLSWGKSEEGNNLASYTVVRHVQRLL